MILRFSVSYTAQTPEQPAKHALRYVDLDIPDLVALRRFSLAGYPGGLVFVDLDLTGPHHYPEDDLDGDDSESEEEE